MWSKDQLELAALIKYLHQGQVLAKEIRGRMPA
jgi:hypothetical protein